MTNEIKIPLISKILMALIAISLILVVTAYMNDPSPMGDQIIVVEETVDIPVQTAIEQYMVINSTWTNETYALDEILYEDMQEAGRNKRALTKLNTASEVEEATVALDDAVYEFLAATQMRRLHAIEFRSFLHKNKDELQRNGVDVDDRLRDMYYMVAICDYNTRLLRDGVRGEVPPDRENFDDMEIYIT